MASAAVVVWSAALLPEVPATAAAAAFAKGLLLDAASGATAETAAAVTGNTAAGKAVAGGISDTATTATAAAVAAVTPDVLLAEWQCHSLLESMLQAEGTSLVRELQAASPLGRLCGLKGLLTAMKLDAICGQLAPGLSLVSPGGSATAGDDQVSQQGYSFIMGCALPAAVAAAEAPPDAHFKFHAVGVINVLLQQVKIAWQQLIQQQCSAITTTPAAAVSGKASKATSPPLPPPPPPAAAAAAEASAAGLAEGGGVAPPPLLTSAAAGVAPDEVPHPATATMQGVGEMSNADGSGAEGEEGSGVPGRGLFAPWLLPDARDRLMGLLWNHMDEPMAQTLRQVRRGGSV
jgi:hypothetical protein